MNAARATATGPRKDSAAPREERSGTGQGQASVLGLSVPSSGKQFNAFSVDRNGLHAALGGTSLYLLDLASKEKEKEKEKDREHQDFRHVNQSRVTGSTYSVLRWNQHHSTLASSFGTTVSVWKLDDSTGNLNPHLSIKGAHKRAITDLGWSPFKQHMLASRSPDAEILIWDVRTKVVKAHTLHGKAGTGYIKWNRLNSSLIASTHYGEVMIWDLRKTSVPTITITGHTADISDIDWAYHNESRLLTASHDSTIKVWDLNEPRTEKEKIRTGMPIACAQFTPFGDGVLSIGRGDRSMHLWSLYSHVTPVYTFQGHAEAVESFEWRVKQSTKNSHTTYGLVSLSKDSTLNVWTIPKSIQDLCKFPSSIRGPSAGGIPESDEKSGDDAQEALQNPGGQATRKISKNWKDVPSDPSSISPSSFSSDSMPSPPSNSYGPILNLKHELALIVEQFKGVEFVEIESADPIARCCIVVLYDPETLSSVKSQASPRPASKSGPSTGEKGRSPNTSRESSVSSASRENTEEEGKLQRKVLIRMQIAFPSFYPHAQPSFTFLPGTTVNQERQILLKRTLAHIATYYSVRGYPSLEKLVMKLINLQRTLDAESRLEQIQKERQIAQKVEEERKEGENNQTETAESPSPSETGQEGGGKEKELEGDVATDDKGRQRSASFSIWEKIWGKRGDPLLLPEEDEEESKDDTSVPSPAAADMLEENQPSPVEVDAAKAVWIPAKSSKDLLGRKLEAGHWRAKVDNHARQVAAAPFVGSFRAPVPLAALPKAPRAELVKTQSFDMLFGSYEVEMSHSSTLLSQMDVQKLVSKLPSRFQMREWQLLYSTMEHGISLHTFFRRVSTHTPTVIVVEDNQKYVFGAFVTGVWEPSGRYTGTGESFLFTLSPYFRVYPWTRANELFMCGAPHSISIGGGAHVGLWLDEDFEFGSSYPCSTFGNECLASGRDFECVVLEAWGL